MKKLFMASVTCFVFMFAVAEISMAEVPSQPTDILHPGSANYEFTFKKENFKTNGRQVNVFLPAESISRNKKAPVVVFGHGQAIDLAGYELTFEHLAKKGVAVIFPMYDKSFLDQDWRRMASDFNQLTAEALNKYSDYIDVDKVIYSGHSKGAYVALIAAGEPGLKINVGSAVLFAPAGFDNEYLKTINPNMPVTLIWSDADTVIKQNLITEIYSKLNVRFKQWILVKSYSSLKADHFFPLSKSYFFGGRNGASAFHFHAVWKWLIGAAWDLDSTKDLSNPYIYGEEAIKTGIDGLNHSITKNW